MFYDYEGKSYFLMTFSPIYQNYIILGEPFLKQNMVIFNQDNKSIGV